MGTKFGNVHIKKDSKEMVLKALAELAGERTAGNSINSVDAFGDLIRKSQTLSYFDHDILEMNVFMNGELATGHIWCSPYVRNDYDIGEKEADISIAAQLI